MATNVFLSTFYLGRATGLIPHQRFGSKADPLRLQTIDLSRTPGAASVTFDLGAGPVTTDLAALHETDVTLHLKDGRTQSGRHILIRDVEGRMFLNIWDAGFNGVGAWTESVTLDAVVQTEASDFAGTVRDRAATVNCYRSDTLIDTPDGPRRIATLRQGDLVETLQNGSQAIRWIGTTVLSRQRLKRQTRLAPIRIAPGTFGRNMPATTLYVSPQHRLLVGGKTVREVCGVEEALVATKHLGTLPGIEPAEAENGVSYTHFVFDRHEVVWANGLPAESLYLGAQSRAALPESQRSEVEELFPELLGKAFRPLPAYPVLKARKAVELLERLGRRKAGAEAPQRHRMLVPGTMN